MKRELRGVGLSAFVARREIDTIVKLQLDGPVGTAPVPVAKDPS